MDNAPALELVLVYGAECVACGPLTAHEFTGGRLGYCLNPTGDFPVIATTEFARTSLIHPGCDERVLLVDPTRYVPT